MIQQAGATDIHTVG